MVEDASSAVLEPSWPQVAIFIDFDFVFDPVGCLPGLSWDGLGIISASSWAYLDPSCGCFLFSSGCLGFPTLPFQDLPRMPVIKACHKMPGSKQGAAVAPPTGLSIK